MSHDLLAPPDPAPGGSFALAKLYGDCVGPSGDAAIVYAGCVVWGGLRCSLSGVSFFDAHGVADESWSLSRGDARLAGRELIWSARDASLRASATGGGFGETLFTSAAGRIAFECLVPDGAVAVRRGARILEGRGYAERLEMTIAPWALPLHSLRWGRFVSPEEQILWIEWWGEHPLRRVFRNGVACEGASIAAGRIEMPGREPLLLGEPRVLRAGRLGGLRGAASELLAKLPGVSGIHESKWVRRGRIVSEGRAVEGWVVDEEVRIR